MARWTNLVSRQESTANRRAGGMVEYRGLVLHTAEGYYEGTIDWQKNTSSQVSSHFVVGKADGQWCQMMDDADGAWTQQAGNYHWLSSENEGFGSKGESLTAWQVEANAQLLAEAHRRRGVPLQIAADPNGRGLGHHSMGCNWPGGAWGHCDCPGNAIIAQKAAIVARAQQIINGGDIFMALSDQDQKDLLRKAGNADQYGWALTADLDAAPSIVPSVGATAIAIPNKAKAARVALEQRVADLETAVADLAAKVGQQPATGDLSVTGTLHVS